MSSDNRLLTTVAYRLQGETCYALEGSIFIAGAAIQWLRDGLKLISSAKQSESIASSLESNHGVYLVPAFTGLGAPYWDPRARGAIFGLTRDTGSDEVIRAALESVCYQSYDLIAAMRRDGAEDTNSIRVDGGMVGNDWLMQFLADILNVAVARPLVTETTALGAAYLAGLQTGLFDSLDDLSNRWQRQREFKPAMNDATRGQLIKGWRDSVSRTLTINE